jgi:hypothetical protein
MSKASETDPRRKVLIVSLHFPPVNAPDMQRTRLALPYLRANGWEPVVLAVHPDSVEGPVLEPRLEKTYPADIRVVRVRGYPFKLTRLVGFGSLWLRCARAIRKAGDKLLSEGGFDLVFFSTTQFDAFTLGPRWKSKFGVPYVLDYQDPWENDYYSRTKTRPPGGWLKFGYSQWTARRREPVALRGASGVVAVSLAYGATFSRKYSWYHSGTLKFLPFGAAEHDFDIARSHKPDHPLVDFEDGLTHIVYAGRCGPDMSVSLKIVFRAFKAFLKARPEEGEKIRFHFIGTDYAPRPLGREWAMPVARDEHVEAYVDEHCYRVPYFDALYYLTRADSLLAVGSNDPSYSASKIFPYVLARRPMLVVFHEKSPVLAMAVAMNCANRFSFKDAGDIDHVSDLVAQEWFISGGMRRLTEANTSAFIPYSAETMTRQLAACFDAALGLGHTTT